MTHFSGSAEVFKWLEKFINFERIKPLPGDFKLERMEALARLAGNPEKSAPVIHVAGSKGKGSVTAMIAAILEAGGIKTARYASPHVSDYRERIGWAGEFFSEEIYTGAGNELAALAETLERALVPLLPGDEGPTFFEMLTLYFFLCARLAGAKAMAVETGLGGRLDATNIVDPLASVITLIEKEHTEYLGNTLEAIAGEKAGIIKPGRPLILAAQKPEVLEVFRQKAAALQAPFHYLNDEAAVENICINEKGTKFDLCLAVGTGGKTHLKDLFVSIPGEIQAYNGALAALAVRHSFPLIDDDAIRRGLSTFHLPGRFEKLQGINPAYIIDGAHTTRSVEACIKTFITLYSSGGILLFGCADGKDIEAMAKILVPHFSAIIITAPGTFKKSDPPKAYDIFRREADEKNKTAELFLIEDTAAAIEKSLEMSRERQLPVLATGSFYLAGEVVTKVILR
ncbi:bifunctional folylpolyglutamate synthase/dihydrofolate synthase [Spirochaetia bacterium]|nr:bifunctional folylpolyglutamate synthase/dihydrofolate synthase [Spirochaetia bacterium]